ncbi:MAG: serine hydrolase domain-containing protein [Acidobacteriota bacterium]
MRVPFARPLFIVVTGLSLIGGSAIAFLPALIAKPRVRQAAGQALSAESTRKLDQVLEAERLKRKIPGISLAVGIDNRLAYSTAAGSSDIENSVAARPESVYRTASIAKAMTAVAVVQLAEQGKLDLDAPIQKYCPAFPVKSSPITARLLLGHLSGIRHYKTPAEPSGTEHYGDVKSSLAIFKDEPLLHEPGTKFLYTTFGYTVLGCAIEGATGLGYDQYMRERVWAPAGMTQTGLDHLRLVIPHRSRGYAMLSSITFLQLPESERRLVKPGEIYNAQLHDTSMKVPGGGLVSTAPDLVRFAIAVNTGKLVNEKSRSEMWTRQKTSDGKETDYGLGWNVGNSRGRFLVSHGGGQAGTSTLLTMLPTKGAIIAIMANLEGADLNDLIAQVARIIAPE